MFHKLFTELRYTSLPATEIYVFLYQVLLLLLPFVQLVLIEPYTICYQINLVKLTAFG